jgi:hypothetical protein
VTPGVIGHGTARAADPAVFAHNSPSLFADPVAWLVSAAVEKCAHVVAGAPDGVGVIAVSEFATLLTMRAIARTASKGRVSPLRFAGANPGALAGLTCLRWGFRGPAMTLSMNPEHGVDTALVLANGLLSAGAAEYMVLATHAVAGEHIARCVVLCLPVGPEVRGLLCEPESR